MKCVPLRGQPTTKTEDVTRGSLPRRPAPAHPQRALTLFRLSRSQPSPVLRSCEGGDSESSHARRAPAVLQGAIRRSGRHFVAGVVRTERSRAQSGIAKSRTVEAQVEWLGGSREAAEGSGRRVHAKSQRRTAGTPLC